MTALSPNNTQRWFYTYANSKNTHEFMIRGIDIATIAGADDLVASLLSAIGNRFGASTITKVEHSAVGSDIRFPVTSARLGDNFGTGSPNLSQDATELNFTGKSTGGRRWRWGLFGWMSDVGDFRQLSSEDSEVADVVALWNSSLDVTVGIDKLPLVVNGYANIKPNDHWVKQSR